MPLDIIIQNPNGAPPKVGTTGDALNVALADGSGGTVSESSPLPVATVNTEKTEGTRTSSHVSDDESISLLTDILQALRITNTHLAIMTGEKINNQEVE